MSIKSGGDYDHRQREEHMHMREQLEQRLAELKAEFEAGQKNLTELAAREENIKTVLHRIAGAIQVLEEELAKAGGGPELNGIVKTP